jgi:hypothetical protein
MPYYLILDSDFSTTSSMIQVIASSSIEEDPKQITSYNPQKKVWISNREFEKLCPCLVEDEYSGQSEPAHIYTEKDAK